MDSHSRRGHPHRTVSVRLSDYEYLSDLRNMLGLREKRPVSLCDAMNWLVQHAKDLKIVIETSPELKVAKK